MFTSLRNRWPFFLLLACSVEFAQMPGPRTHDRGSVRGVVVSADGSEPLRKATVTLCDASNPQECSGAVTDVTGQFEITGVDPGRYILTAACNGYVEQPYGQRSVNGAGVVLRLAPGQSLSGLTIKLLTGAVITGNVYDEAGLPMAGVLVAELRPVYNWGERQLRVGAVATTNDLGEYRIWGLNPGPHFVLAEPAPPPIGVRTDLHYLPTFHPGELDAVHAVPVVARLSDQLSGIVIDMQPARGVGVSGRLYGGGQNPQVFLLQRDISALGDLVPPLPARVQNNDFEFANVAPGAYYLYATAEDSRGGRMLARQPLQVAATGFTRFDLTLQRLTELTGNVIVEGAEKVDTRWEVSFVPRNGRMILGEPPDTRTGPGGDFTLHAFSPGDYLIRVENLADDWYLKAARLDGSDVLGSGWSTEVFPYPQHLDLLVSPNGATVDGYVTRGQKTCPGATVVLVPNPPRRGEQQLYKATSTDDDGRFLIQGAAPGDYKVFAWESVEDGAYRNAEFLEPFETRGQGTHLQERSHASVNLDLIPTTDAVP
jgi:protocatechuate 3,4-dioxygenase beta subunit